MITFLELRIQKKSEKRPQKWARNSDPFLVPLSIGIFPEGSENGRILGPAFWCWRTTFELIFGIAQSGRGATISSATCSRRTPKCSQLMLALKTYSFQKIKLKLAAFLPSAAPTGEAPCGAHVFEGFFGLEKFFFPSARQSIFAHQPRQFRAAGAKRGCEKHDCHCILSCATGFNLR